MAASASSGTRRSPAVTNPTERPAIPDGTTPRPAAVAIAADGLTIDWPDRRWTFHPIWLREQSRDPAARDSVIGQRLFEAWRLPLDLAITAALMTGDTVDVTFSDGHRTGFPIGFLRRECERSVPDDLAGTPRPWDAGMTPRPTLPWSGVMASDRTLLALADLLAERGFCILTDGPIGMDDAERVANRFGPIRRTNWGGVADVKLEAVAVDLTQTNRWLEPATSCCTACATTPKAARRPWSTACTSPRPCGARPRRPSRC